MKYYFFVIFKGIQTGIFSCWHTEVKPAVTGFPDAKFYGFEDYEAAWEAWNMGQEKYEEWRYRDRDEEQKEFEIPW